jgi:glycerol-3-phosphate acyltransferase PlsY
MIGLLVALFLSYLIGSVSFAILVSQRRGLADPRSYGSGNPGATNMLRSGDRWAAGLTLAGDAVKGLFAVLLVKALMLPLATDLNEAAGWLAASAFGVFLGHLFPVFFGFKGGKGVATALGVLLGLSLPLGLTVLLVWLAIFALTRISSLSALGAAVSAPALAAMGWVGSGSPVISDTAASVSIVHDPVWWAITFMTFLLLARHHSNIRGLISGREKPMATRQTEDGSSDKPPSC